MMIFKAVAESVKWQIEFINVWMFKETMVVKWSLRACCRWIGCRIASGRGWLWGQFGLASLYRRDSCSSPCRGSQTRYKSQEHARQNLRDRTICCAFARRCRASSRGRFVLIQFFSTIRSRWGTLWTKLRRPSQSCKKRGWSFGRSC